MSPSSPHPHRSQTEFVVVNSWEVVVLRPHRSSALQQQSSSMKRSVDRKDSTYSHTNEHWIHEDPSKTKINRIPRDLSKTHLHTPFDDSRHIAGMGARRGGHYSIFRGPPHPRLPEQDTNRNRPEKTLKKRSRNLPTGKGRGPPCLHGPKAI